MPVDHPEKENKNHNKIIIQYNDMSHEGGIILVDSEDLEEKGDIYDSITDIGIKK